LQLAANEKNSTASYLVAHMLENELGVKRSI
jgi:TPR repeat protein